MSNLNENELESLKNVDPKFFGYGEPGTITKTLMSEGLLTIEVLEGDQTLWHAFLTEAGVNLLAEQVKLADD